MKLGGKQELAILSAQRRQSGRISLAGEIWGLVWVSEICRAGAEGAALQRGRYYLATPPESWGWRLTPKRDCDVQDATEERLHKPWLRVYAWHCLDAHMAFKSRDSVEIWRSR